MTESMVDVDGVALSSRVTGSGSPAMVFLSCLGGDHDMWSSVVDLLSPTTTCITYARAGIGASGDLSVGESSVRRSSLWAAEQLRALLAQMQIRPPFVFATGSIGAYIADRYATTWPDEVAALVLVDPTNLAPMHPDLPTDRVLVDGREPGGATIALTQWQNDLHQSRAPAGPEAVVVSSAVGRWLRLDPAKWAPAPLAEVDTAWQQQQRAWAERWAATHVIARTAGHHVYVDQPALVATVIEDAVAASGQDRAVRLDDESLARVDGYLAPPRA